MRQPSEYSTMHQTYNMNFMPIRISLACQLSPLQRLNITFESGVIDTVHAPGRQIGKNLQFYTLQVIFKKNRT